MAYIYMVTNLINGKKYIGQTVRITAGGYKWMYVEEYNELQNKDVEKL